MVGGDRRAGFVAGIAVRMIGLQQNAEEAEPLLAAVIAIVPSSGQMVRGSGELIMTDVFSNPSETVIVSSPFRSTSRLLISRCALPDAAFPLTGRLSSQVGTSATPPICRFCSISL